MYNIIRLLRVVIIGFYVNITYIKYPRGFRLRKTLEMLGPSFIKLGQALSVRIDIIGVDTASHLSSLQDRLPPYSTYKAQKIIEKELGSPLSEIFSEFSKKPIAAASIAQVYQAKLSDGRKVAVKVARPGIYRQMKRDVALFYFIARILNCFKKLKRLKLIEVVDVFASTVKKEMDFRFEAAAAAQLKENTLNDADFYVPEIYWEFTSMRVLTIEWVEGIQITDIKGLKAAGHDLKVIAERFATSFLNQTFRDGFFHADTHPGNLFVGKNGEIIPVDFGIMGRLEKRDRIFVAQILRGFLSGDYHHVAQVHFDAGYVPNHKAVYDFALACRAIGEPIMGLPANKISIAKLLALLFKITEDFDMETQPQLLLLQKTMVLVEGIGQQLYPEVNMWQLTEGWIKDWAQDNFSAKARILSGLDEIKELFKDLPARLKKLEKALDKMVG